MQVLNKTSGPLRSIKEEPTCSFEQKYDPKMTISSFSTSYNRCTLVHLKYARWDKNLLRYRLDICVQSYHHLFVKCQIIFACRTNMWQTYTNANDFVRQKLAKFRHLCFWTVAFHASCFRTLYIGLLRHCIGYALSQRSKTNQRRRDAVQPQYHVDVHATDTQQHLPIRAVSQHSAATSTNFQTYFRPGGSQLVGLRTSVTFFDYIADDN